jgi:hypothetical protein
MPSTVEAIAAFWCALGAVALTYVAVRLEQGQ